MDAIILHGVKTHNLKNLDLTLPHRRLYVLTGVSGSGKSSLAFDTLYAEGQRRYVESLSAYARQFLERMEKPDIESTAGIPPAIAIEAKNVVSNARSTVGTQTEVNDYLRVLFSRVGQTFCPTCHLRVMDHHPESVAGLLFSRFPERDALILFRVSLGEKGSRYTKEFLPELERQGFIDFFFAGAVVSRDALLKKKKKLTEVTVCADALKLSRKNRKRLIDSLEQAFRYGRGEIQVALNDKSGGDQSRKLLKFSEGLCCYACGKVFREPTPNLFSFNSPLGACPTCQGFGRVMTLDWDLIVPDSSKSISGGAIEPWTKPSASWEFEQLLSFCQKERIPIHQPWKKLRAKHREWILQGPGHTRREEDYFSVRDFFDYLEKKTYKMHIRIFLSKYRRFVTCPSCCETRLKPEALCVRILGEHIYHLQTMSLDRLAVFFDRLTLSEAEAEKVGPVLLEIRRRLRFLNEIGLGYLSLSRLSRTLSGGEMQRIHLASSLGAALVDTLYVLDEPSIGLHERDNQLLIRLLKELRDLGNTVVVVEHDRTMISAADEVVDLGPLGGEKGGEIVFQGRVSDLKKCESSLTGRYLAGKLQVKRTCPSRTVASPRVIRIQGAAEHNLKEIDVTIPLRHFAVITGVSGSGKSTLLYDVLFHRYLRFRGRPVQDLGRVRSVRGFEHVDEIVWVDQSPIGRTPRSNPVTYLKAFEEIRRLFAQTPQARRAGLNAGHFSFNVDGGRCLTCKGDGRVKVEMHFLADVYVPCQECQGKRFKPEMLEVRHKGKNVDDVLSLTVDEAVDFFGNEEKLVQKLEVLKKVGLGYLRLGQSATTLSGGEAQRLKLAFEMTGKKARHILYLFDEPTTGLHYHDILFLMESVDELLKRGHSVVMIEHNMEIIRSADFIVDLGPEGGEQGGKVLYQGPLKGVLKVRNSHTGQCLQKYLDATGLSPNIQNVSVAQKSNIKPKSQKEDP